MEFPMLSLRKLTKDEEAAACLALKNYEGIPGGAVWWKAEELSGPIGLV